VRTSEDIVQDEVVASCGLRGVCCCREVGARLTRMLLRTEGVLALKHQLLDGDRSVLCEDAPVQLKAEEALSQIHYLRTGNKQSRSSAAESLTSTVNYGNSPHLSMQVIPGMSKLTTLP